MKPVCEADSLTYKLMPKLRHLSNPISRDTRVDTTSESHMIFKPLTDLSLADGEQVIHLYVMPRLQNTVEGSAVRTEFVHIGLVVEYGYLGKPRRNGKQQLWQHTYAISLSYESITFNVNMVVSHMAQTYSYETGRELDLDSLQNILEAEVKRVNS